MYTTGSYILYKEHMNLRSKPSASSSILGSVERGKRIEVEEVCDNWGKITVNGITGWCCISECFAEKVCDCSSESCVYLNKYLDISSKYENLKKRLERIKEII